MIDYFNYTFGYNFVIDAFIKLNLKKIHILY
uniref:Uncharacterized protein n=1 Tax=viral metagenome TaxID=1070528 RepID=A0A6C0D1I3_9ZZZZ